MDTQIGDQEWMILRVYNIKTATTSFWRHIQNGGIAGRRFRLKEPLEMEK